VWLWRAHNMVNSRLLKDDQYTSRPQWPSVTACAECYSAQWRNESTPVQINNASWEPLQWQESNIWVYLQVCGERSREYRRDGAAQAARGILSRAPGGRRMADCARDVVGGVAGARAGDFLLPERYATVRAVLRPKHS